MQVTDVRVRKIYEEGKMKAIVSVTFNDQFVVHDIKIIDGQNGLFIAMPSRKIGEGEFRDIAHPINSETRELVQDAVFEQYEKELEAMKEEADNSEEESQVDEPEEDLEQEESGLEEETQETEEVE